MTLAQTARGAGTTAAQVMKLENGERRLTIEWVERLSRAFGCDVLDLIAPARMVPVNGFLTDSWSVDDRKTEARVPGTRDVTVVPIPRGCSPDRVIAIRRETANRCDFFAGATFYFEQRDDSSITAFDGMICLITLTNGARHVRRVQAGGQNLRIKLHGPLGAPSLEATNIVACSPCLAMITGADAARRLCGPHFA